ncbi:disease resistance protein RGA5-like [Oryza glaberrima]|uniref:disease resistance protein RGA5-like n=1 Tax=Oryza glaberrima TaxID=4538 RepID=UPI00224C163E|nr:disease resistance protein RGA5-like [Oryza glaberrima]
MAGATVSVSTGAMSTLLPKLSLLIQGEYKHLKGVKGGISFLKDELSSMHTLLVKLANKEEKLDVQVKDWRNKVRELSYDIEDCIDLFMHKVSGSNAKASLVQKTAAKIRKLWSRHKIANLIEELKARVIEESDRRLRYNFDEVADKFGHVQIDPRLPALYVEAEKLVGIDGPREKIIEWLEKDESRKLKIVSIVGFGGLGKTTLANQVYHNIKGQFDCSSFVPISRNPNTTKILADMLKELGSDVDTSYDQRQLISKLRTFLKHKRYLIIVDDIWSTQAWELVKCALPENNLCSRIISTTRNADVATSCCSSLAGYIHNIQPLNEHDSQKLFFKRIFGDKSACPPYLEQVSHGIISKCHGLPLAIISIASLLAGKSRLKEQWEQVYNSIGFAFSHQGIRDILLLSYYDLPIHLKTCLLYLSLFPEDYEIGTEELIWRWIAEGFISEVKGQTLDQVAENYFNDLVNRSMIQPVDIKYDGRADACKLHDMVLDLIISLSTQENFTTIVEGQQYKCSSNKIRRISIHSKCLEDEVMQEIMTNCSQVRSISFYGLEDQETSLLPTLNSLRVLAFENRYHLGSKSIKHLGRFFQLTYLRINSPGIYELPEQIGGLQNLLTLDIRGSRVEKLPSTIGCLKNLVRLLVYGYVKLPNEIGDLQALQQLSHADNYNSIVFVEELKRLANLREIDIKLHGSARLGDQDMARYMEALKSSLAVMGKQGLQSLEIRYDDTVIGEKLMDLFCYSPCLRKLVIDNCKISRLSKQMALLVNLRHLDIGVSSIKQDDLCVLGSIPTLLFVRLFVVCGPDERLAISGHQFQCLKEFIFISYGGGLEMLFLQEAMPELRWLSLYFCAEETDCKMGFEFSFKHLASLEHLQVTIDCRNATRSWVETAEASVRNAASAHPGCPRIEIIRKFEDCMRDDEVDKEEILKDIDGHEVALREI